MYRKIAKVVKHPYTFHIEYDGVLTSTNTLNVTNCNSNISFIL